MVDPVIRHEIRVVLDNEVWMQRVDRYRVHVADPKVTEPDQEPEDDTEAEVPDVREDPVPDDPA